MGIEITDLTINGQSITSLYGMYITKTFRVNRRYQRKLIWTIDEKRSFIDSIIKGYPVPLILLADIQTENGKRLEIIDGLQRLNAIFSFIDQEFDIGGQYFDLEATGDSKLLKDRKELIQKEPTIDRDTCANMVRYQIPTSIFQDSSDNDIDEVFRRLNSGGKQLSKQELRQAGSINSFANTVRKIACNIRGDSSAIDILDLKSMGKISITNRFLKYGIAVEDIFWVKNNILNKDGVRESRDEEVIADIIGWILSEKPLRSSSSILDQLYDFKTAISIEDTTNTFPIDEIDKSNTLANQIELQILKYGEETIIHNIELIFDKIIEILNYSGKTFNSLLFADSRQKISRYFQIVFLTLYRLIIEEDMDIINLDSLVDKLDGAGDSVITLSEGGGNWSAREKQTQINALHGVIHHCFEKSSLNDAARNNWIVRFESILTSSTTEQTLYDFKIGLYELNKNNKFSQSCFSKIIKTLTAMANTLPNAMGYCIIGVADTIEDAKKYEKFYGCKSREFSDFYITGIENEANSNCGNVDEYFRKIVNLIHNEPISQDDEDYICRNIKIIKYYEKSVIVLQIKSSTEPSIYDGKFFVRHGNSTVEVEAQNYRKLYDRFNK